MKELENFMRVKREESDPSKRKYYFKAQVQSRNGVVDSSQADADIGKELAYMTGSHMTKFISILSIDAAHGKAVSSFIVSPTKTFDPSNMFVRVAFVRNNSLDYSVFATLLIILYGYGWPTVFDDHGDITGDQFLKKTFKSYRKKHNGLYIGYLLGYVFDDIMAWGYGNGTLPMKEHGRAAYENKIKDNCAQFVTEAVTSQKLKDCAVVMDRKNYNIYTMFPHLY